MCHLVPVLVMVPAKAREEMGQRSYSVWYNDLCFGFYT